MICCLKGVHAAHIPLKPNETKIRESSSLFWWHIGLVATQGREIGKWLFTFKQSFQNKCSGKCLEASQEMPCDLQLDCQVISPLLNISSFTAFLWNKQSQFGNGERGVSNYIWFPLEFLFSVLNKETDYQGKISFYFHEFKDI